MGVRFVFNTRACSRLWRLILRFHHKFVFLTQLAIAQKDLRFRDLAMGYPHRSAAEAPIILAWFDFGVWSLVAQSLITSAMGAVLLWYMSAWRPRAEEFSFQCVKELWPYSSKMFAFAVLKYFTMNTDKLVIGYFLGPVALGLYTFAYRIIVQPTSAFVGAIGAYLFPKISMIQDDPAEIRSSYLFVSKATNTVITPLLIMVMILSPMIIAPVFGEKWEPAVPLIQILAVFAITIPWISHVGQVMKALNRPGWLLSWVIFVAALVAVSVWFGSSLGVEGATFGLLAAYVIALPVNFWLLSKLIDAGFMDILSTFIPSVFSAGLMGLALWLTLAYNKFAAAYAVSIGALLAVFLYFMVLMFIDRRFLVNFSKKLLRLEVT